MTAYDPPSVYLSLIVPVFNEAERIGKSLDQILDFFGRQSYSSEIIIVDDGSRDATAEIIRQRCNERVKILRQARNLGKGEAVKQGMLAARGQYLFFTDADLSVPIQALPAFLSHLENGSDITIGSRQTPGARIEVHQPVYRELMGKVFTWLSNLYLGVAISDFTCGFKGFRRDAARALFPRQRLKNWSFDAELLFLAKLKEYKIVELPVTWRNDGATKVRLCRDAVTSLLGLIQIRLYHRWGRHREPD